MAESKDPRQDDHIEDLLSQLQGIFGRLSKTEQEEADQKVDPAHVKTKAPEAEPEPAPPVEEAKPIEQPPPAPPVVVEPSPAPPPEPPIPEPPPPAPVAEAPAPPEPVAPPPVEEAPPPASPPPAPAQEPAPAAPIQAAGFESVAPAVTDDGSLLRTAVFFPAGRESEAKTLATKIESMTPRFTKVAFQLRVSAFHAYDPKAEWREAVLNQVQQGGARAVFVLVNSPLEDARRKALSGDLEPRGIYFQEVPVLSVEKKAFYMDLLLGIVFFFDSLKPASE